MDDSSHWMDSDKVPREEQQTNQWDIDHPMKPKVEAPNLKEIKSVKPEAVDNETEADVEVKKEEVVDLQASKLVVVPQKQNLM